MAELAVPRVPVARKQPFWSQRKREALTGFLFAGPWVIGFILLTLGPILISLYVSFTSYDIANAPKWIGAQNYQFIFQHDSAFRISLGNTIWYVIFKTPVVIVTSLFLAIMMNQKVPGLKYFRTLYYMPTIVTGVAAVFLWIWILAPVGGIINNLLTWGPVCTPLAALHAMGPDYSCQNPPYWFLDPNYSKPGMIIMGTWYIGAPMLILLAGLNGIPAHLYEAAKIDGAGILRRFWNVTIPMLSPTLFFIVLTNIIGAFQVFNSAYIISTTVGASRQIGDPSQSLLFYEVYIYNFFSLSQMGYANALAWILFVVVFFVTVTQLYLSRKWVYYEGG